MYTTRLIISLLVATTCWMSTAHAEEANSQLQALEAGQMAFNTGNYELAFALWQTEASQGNPNAQVFVGLAYANGWGVDKSAHLAEIWYQKAAENGNASGQMLLGFHLLHMKQADLGLQWLQKAAAGGETTAQEFLEKGYERGWFKKPVPSTESQPTAAPGESKPPVGSLAMAEAIH